MSSDERSRSAQRAQDHASVLIERMRTGSLTRQRAELAAYCGDPDALRAVGETNWPPRADDFNRWQRKNWGSWTDAPREAELVEWALGLDEWGREVVVRAALTAAECASVRWTAELALDPDRYEDLCGADYVPTLLHAAAEWLRCPCDPHRIKAKSALEMGRQETLTPSERPPDYWALLSAEAAARTIFAKEGIADWGAVALVSALMALRRDPSGLEPSPDERASIRNVIHQSLCSWALGEGGVSAV